MAYNNRSYRGNSERPQMHEAICSKCGKTCLVPFNPTGNRPVFCSDCFKKEGGASSRRTDERRARFSADRPMFDAVCDKCGNRCQVPFQPRSGRQTLCSHCFEQKSTRGSQDDGRFQEQLDAINIKLGKILQLLSNQDKKAITIEMPDETSQEEIKPDEILAVERVSDNEPETTGDATTKKKRVSKKKTSEGN